MEFIVHQAVTLQPTKLYFAEQEGHEGYFYGAHPVEVIDTTNSEICGIDLRNGRPVYKDVFQNYWGVRTIEMKKDFMYGKPTPLTGSYRKLPGGTVLTNAFPTSPFYVVLFDKPITTGCVTYVGVDLTTGHIATAEEMDVATPILMVVEVKMIIH